MNNDPIRGQTIRFTFSDGPMAKKTFEHVFETKGTVSFRMVGGNAPSAAGKDYRDDDTKKALEPKYEVATLRDDIGAVSYLGSGGYTLTTVLDFKTKKLVAFSSVRKGRFQCKHGTFRVRRGRRRLGRHRQTHTAGNWFDRNDGSSGPAASRRGSLH